MAKWGIHYKTSRHLEKGWAFRALHLNAKAKQVEIYAYWINITILRSSCKDFETINLEMNRWPSMLSESEYARTCLMRTTNRPFYLVRRTFTKYQYSPHMTISTLWAGSKISNVARSNLKEMWPHIKLVAMCDHQNNKWVFHNGLMWLIVIAHKDCQLQAPWHAYKNFTFCQMPETA